VLVLSRHEFLPGRTGVTAEDGVEFAVKPHAVLVEIPDAERYKIA
jgi:hypothetical protein